MRPEVVQRLAAAVRAQAQALTALAEMLEAHGCTATASVAPSDGWLTLRETGLPVTTLHAAIKRGELPAVKVGRELRVRRSDLDAWMASRPPARRQSNRGPSSDPEDVDAEIDRLLEAGRIRRVK